MIARLALTCRALAALTLAAVALTTSTQAVELNPAAVTYITPDKFKWRDPTGAAPVNNVILHGDPTKPGFYVVLN
jgi:hypothetical protein